jgi:hypothetical protein
LVLDRKRNQARREEKAMKPNRRSREWLVVGTVFTALLLAPCGAFAAQFAARDQGSGKSLSTGCSVVQELLDSAQCRTHRRTDVRPSRDREILPERWQLRESLTRPKKTRAPAQIYDLLWRGESYPVLDWDGRAERESEIASDPSRVHNDDIFSTLCAMPATGTSAGPAICGG